MTQRIEQLISDIHSKVEHLHQSLVQERTKSLTFSEELEALRKENTQLQTALHASKESVEGLKGELEKIKENVVSTPVRGRNDQEIDELVKEIEYCISQLKK
jgi:hypothetical protein